jgi:hypothetical protein
MSRTMPFGSRLLLLVLLCSTGCSNHQTLADRLAEATRVVACKRTNPHEAVSISFEGEEAQRIVRAVSSAKPSGGDAAPSANAIRIEFLRGTNRLAIIECVEGLFWIPSEKIVYYSDNTQTLSRLEAIPQEKWHPMSEEAYWKVR